MKFLGKMLLPVCLIFMAVNIFILFTDSIWGKYHIDKYILLWANLLFFTLSLMVFFIQQKALKNPNPNVFVRSVVAGMMIKMFAVVIAVVSYVIATGKNYDKKAVFISLFLYLIYLAAEVMAIFRENKQRNA